MRNPNSLDNRKTVSLKSSSKQVKDIHQELADSCFKIIPYVLFAPHSDKAIITLELKIYQGLAFPPIHWVAGIPHTSARERQSLSAVYFSQRQIAQQPLIYTHAYSDTGFPQHWFPAQHHINIYGSCWVCRGLFLTDKDIQRSNPLNNCFVGLSALLRLASRQPAYLNLFFNLS